MLVVKQALTEEALICLQYLRKLDLSSVAIYTTDSQVGYGWTPLQGSCAIRRYKTFWFISYLYPNKQLVPTQEIDLFWHCHITFTRKYRQDCQLIFGYYLDHDPCLGELREEDWQTFAETKVLLSAYEHLFQAEEIALPQVAVGSKELVLADKPSACGRPAIAA